VPEDDVSRTTGSDDGRVPRSRPTALVLAAVVWAAASVLAFRTLDPILAAFLVIMGLTALVIGLAARDWDRHSTFEERELVRARKRKAKWEASKDARDRDRALWEAHRAQQAKKSPR
jgi:isoaspartyl peptidase/L-asparaginase-like protein (Ntn-hydrolase superfamily)